MRQLIYLSIALLSYKSFVAQESTTEIEMKTSKWILPEEASFERFDNRETLLLNGKAIVKNQQFSNGTIEVDVYAKSARSFAGIFFRKQKNTMEEVYMRLHKSDQADAIQYSPTYKDELTWQLYKEYQANVSFKKKGWNTLRIDINNHEADVFVNNTKVLSINNLRIDNKSGEIGLFALFHNRFSNFKFTSRESSSNQKLSNGEKKSQNIISQWNITKAFPFIEKDLKPQEFSNKKYITVTTEKSGLLPISKYIEKSFSGNFEKNKEMYTIASSIIETAHNQKKIFSFDYSDKIIVFLNGEAIFKGNNAFRSKGIQYTGHIDINTNKLYLDLKKGKNILHCVVIDKANGWGIIGKLE